MSLEIRPLTRKEWIPYIVLRREALETSPQAFATTLAEFDGRTLEFYKKRHEKTVSDPTAAVYGAFDGRRMVGMAGYNRHAGVDDTLFIFGVYLSPSHRGQGVGKQLMQAIEAGIREIDQIEAIELAVKRDNRPVIRLYRSLGYIEFEPGADHPIQASICSTEIQMRKSLT